MSENYKESLDVPDDMKKIEPNGLIRGNKFEANIEGFMIAYGNKPISPLALLAKCSFSTR